MTPAINITKKKGIQYKVHEYDHEPTSESYDFEAAEKLGVPKDRVFKALVVNLDKKELAVAVLPVSMPVGFKGQGHHLLR